MSSTGQQQHLGKKKNQEKKKNCSHIVITSEFKYIGDGHGVAAKQNRRTPDNFNSRAL